MRATELRELKRLLDALQHSGNRQYKVQLRYVHDFVQRTARFRAIFDVLKASSPDFDADEWIQTKVFGVRETCHEWPGSEQQKLRVLLRILELVATNEDCNPVGIGQVFTYSSNLDHSVQAFTKHVVYPLADYLQARLAAASEILHQLERMRRQVEWFEQDRLFEAFSANRSQGEGVYDRHVRQFLFAEGVDYPFSQPASASGKADVIAGIDDEDPLVCEIKLYDGESYGAACLRQGIGQAVRYAHDYGKSVSYLVIFNLSEERLQLPTDEPVETNPPRLQIQSVTVFMIVVQARPVPFASKDRHRGVRVLERERLVQANDSPIDVAAPLPK